MVFIFFLCDFGEENQGVDISPRLKGTPSTETSKSVMSRAKRFVKLKPRKQVKEQVRKTPVFILETPKSTKVKISEVKAMTQEQSTNKPVQRRLTRSQIAKEKGKSVISGESSSLKGDLNDILKAIGIAKSPLVQADVIEFDKGKSKKMKPSKKLEFEDDITTFVFKPRKSLTRQSKKMQESNIELGKTEEASAIQEELLYFPSPRPEGNKNRVFSTQTKKSSYKEMEERLGAANNEIARLRMRARRNVAEKTDFKRIKALWEVEKKFPNQKQSAVKLNTLLGLFLQSKKPDL